MTVTLEATPEELQGALAVAARQFPLLADVKRPKLGAKLECELEAPGGPYQLLIELRADGG